jgi:hypothetical protein
MSSGPWENKHIIYYGKIYFVLPELTARHEFADTKYAGGAHGIGEKIKIFTASADHFYFFPLSSTCQKTSMKDFQQAAFSGKQYAGDCVFPVSVGAMAVPSCKFGT